MATASQSNALSWRSVTPLRLYLLITGLLVLFVTSPFTIGPGLAWVGDWLSRAFDVLARALDVISAVVTAVQWPASHPVLCWLSKAVLGTHLIGGVGLCLWKGKTLIASGRRVAVATSLILIATALYGWLSTFDPSVQDLYGAFLSAGGTPEWLVGGATAVVVVLAYSPVIAAAVAAAAAFWMVFLCAF